MNKEEFLSKYWRYYLNIENDVINLEKYITFDKRNYRCFSVEFIKIIQVICSEIDVVLHLITSKGSMNEYKEFLLNDIRYKCIQKSKTQLKLNKEIQLSPFKLLKKDKGLTWWGSYNDIKHHRQDHDNFIKANLYNVLTSLSALYFLECLYYNFNYYDINDNDSDSMPRPKSKLFESINNIKDNVVDTLEFNKCDEWDD